MDKLDLYINKITVLVWFYSKSFAVFVGLSQDFCFVYIYIYKDKSSEIHIAQSMIIKISDWEKLLDI